MSLKWGDGTLVRVDEGRKVPLVNPWGLAFAKESVDLFFGFFVGPLFLHAFGGFFFGFFACVLAFAHGYAPCVVRWYGLLCGAVRGRMVTNL